MQVAVSGACSLLWCVGFFLHWLFLLHCTGLGAWASAVAAPSLSLCGTQALIGPRHVESSWTRIELTSRPLAGGFLSTILPRNPRDTHLYDFLKAVCFSFLILLSRLSEVRLIVFSVRSTAYIFICLPGAEQGTRNVNMNKSMSSKRSTYVNNCNMKKHVGIV